MTLRIPNTQVSPRRGSKTTHALKPCLKEGKSRVRHYKMELRGETYDVMDGRTWLELKA